MPTTARDTKKRLSTAPRYPNQNQNPNQKTTASANQLQTLNWLNEVSSQFTSEGNVNEKYYDRRPAASTALNSIIEQLLTSLRKLHLEFFLNHHDIILMMRCLLEMASRVIGPEERKRLILILIDLKKAYLIHHGPPAGC